MNICTLTDAAQTRINELCNENEAFAVTLNVKGGGCAGFEYDWQLVNDKSDVEDDDEFISENFLIGSTSLMFLFGSIIDYKKDIIGSMFDIQNPNAQSACGCGVSVNFNMDNIPQF
jgi:iron-sulfur cluster assembly accessory protein